MAKGTLGQVIQRAISDAAFRNTLRTDPGAALSGFDLTPDERAAIKSGDATKLASFGVDQRMSKAFAMGEAASGVSKVGLGNDLSVGATIPDGGEPLVTDGILDDASGAVRSARISDAGGSVRAGVTGEGSGSRTALGDQHDVARSAISDETTGGRTALGDQHDVARSAISDEATGGRTALGDQHDVVRSAVDGGGTAGRAADIRADDLGNYITADEAGGTSGQGASAADDATARLAQVNAAYEGSDNLVTSGDNDATARLAQVNASYEASDNLVTSGDNDATARLAQVNAAYEDSDNLVGGTGGRSALGDQHDLARSTIDDSTASWKAAPIDDGAEASAFLSAEEMGDEANRVVDSADVQRESLDDGTAMADPQGYDGHEPTA